MGCSNTEYEASNDQPRNVHRKYTHFANISKRCVAKFAESRSTTVELYLTSADELSPENFNSVGRKFDINERMFNFLNKKVGSLRKKILDILQTTAQRYSVELESYMNRNGRK